MRVLTEETGLRATIDRQLWTGRRNGRPALYSLNLHPAEIRTNLAGLLAT